MRRRGGRPAQSWLTRLRETIARATRLISSTNPVSTSAPAQAISCHDVYGLPANWSITTGPLAIGQVKPALQYWLPKARKRAVERTSVSVRGDDGGRRIIK